jgi:Glycosyl hydrolase family 3 C terminal domain.
MAKAEKRGSEKAPVGGDRTDLGLKPDQVALIKAVAKANPNTLVVIEAGSAVIVRDWIDDVPAAMQIFYPGMEGGSALADLITGTHNPSGKLPFTVARDAADYPFFDKDAEAIEYDLWHGYGKFQRDGAQAEFCFGHGLSYTRFEYRALKAALNVRGDIAVTVSVTNVGSRTGDEIVQLYVGPPGQACERWNHQLKAFTRITLEPGERKTVRLSVRRDDLCYFDETAKVWRLEAGEHRIWVGGSSELADLIEARVQL